MPTEEPSGWRRVRFDALYEPVKRMKGDEDLPILSVTKDGITLQADHFNKQIASKDTSKYLRVRRGEIALSGLNLWLGGIDTQRLVPEGVVSPAYRVYSVPSDAADPRFMTFMIRSPIMMSMYGEVSQQGASIVRRNVDFDLLHASPIPLPPLPEQEKIAAILSAVDEAIQSTRAVIEQTRRVKAGLLQDLLSEGIGHTRFKQTQIGKIPEGWMCLTAQECLRRGFLSLLKDGNHGAQYPRSAEFTAAGTPLLAASNITDDGQITWDTVPRLPETVVKRLRIPPARGGDVILTHNASVGKVATLSESLDVIVLGTSTTAYRCVEPLLNKSYLAAFLRSEHYQGQLRRVMSQTTRNQVPITAQRRLFIVVPSPDEQHHIAERAEAVENALEANRMELDARLRMNAGVRQDLLTGRVRVSV